MLPRSLPIFGNASCRDGTPLKGWTIRGAVSVLSGVFAEAVDQGLLAADPVQKVARRKREKVSDEGLKRVLSPDEVEMLKATARQRGLEVGSASRRGTQKLARA